MGARRCSRAASSAGSAEPGCLLSSNDGPPSGPPHPADRLLGLFLVSEQQHRRRQAHVLAALHAANVRTQHKLRWRERRAATMAAAAAAAAAATAAEGCSDPQSDCQNGQEVAAEGSVDLTAQGGASAAAAVADGTPQQPCTRSSGVTRGDLSGDLSRAASGQLPLYRQDYLRLRSIRWQGGLADTHAAWGGGAGGEPEDEAVAGSAAVVAAAVGRGGEGEQPPRLVALAPSASTRSAAALLSEAAVPERRQEEGRANGAPSGLSCVGVQLGSRYTPLLTPSGCAVRLDPPLSPQQAADIYCGRQRPVDSETLRRARGGRGGEGGPVLGGGLSRLCCTLLARRTPWKAHASLPACHPALQAG